MQQSHMDQKRDLLGSLNLDNTWRDLGEEIEVYGVETLLLWVSVTIGLSKDIRFRILNKLERLGVNEYNNPILKVQTTDVLVNAEYKELDVDADQKIVIPFSLKRCGCYLQVQACVGTHNIGGVAQVLEATATKI